MKNLQSLEMTVDGMDCAECVRHVQQSLEKLSGVKSVEALWSTKKVTVCFDPAQLGIIDIRKALELSGYRPLTLGEHSFELSNQQTIEVGINGMDCAECARHVQDAIRKLPGVESIDIFISSKKAVIQLDSTKVQLADIDRVVVAAGYSLSKEASDESRHSSFGNGFPRTIMTIFGITFGLLLIVELICARLGFASYTKYVPLPLGIAIVIIAGFPIFYDVIRMALKGRITAHTLMTVGLIAALALGQWDTGAVIVTFIYIGMLTEKFTAERARRAVKDLTAMAPRKARVKRGGKEIEIPVSEVTVGEIVIVRPGEKIPVDGEVIFGQATVDQATITGESIPVEVWTGKHVFAATLASLGSLHIRTTRVGADTTFGRVIKMVEEAERHRASVQRVADKFSTYYLPIVIAVATLTFVIRRDPLAVAAVLIVACSCSFALATPIAMLASIGASAKRGLLIKGGKYLELLNRANVLLIDKTGTLTLGRPKITDVIPLENVSASDLLCLAASAERYSEHPLASSVRIAAQQNSVLMYEPQDFVAVPGRGISAKVNGNTVAVGNHLMIQKEVNLPIVEELEKQGKTLLFVSLNDRLIGIIAASDTLRPEVPRALAAVSNFGFKHIELLTGDNERTASAIAERLNISYRANLLPEDKIAIVKSYQHEGFTVLMIGDGVNDAPALAQSDIGLAMGAAGTDIAIEAAHIALMRDDWMLVPEVLQIARRTMGVVKLNIAFTAVYNLAGLSLAALGILPPIFAAVAQSIPDVGILLNSARLLNQTEKVRSLQAHRDGMSAPKSFLREV